MDIENTVKAAQSADLLLSDLQQLHRSCDPILSLLILPEIEKIALVKNRLEEIASTLQMTNSPSPS